MITNLKKYALLLFGLAGSVTYAQDYYFKTYPQIDQGLTIADLDRYKDDIWITFKGERTNYPAHSGVAFYKLDGSGNLSSSFSSGSQNLIEDFSYNLTSTGPEFQDGTSWVYGYSSAPNTIQPLSWVKVTDDLQFPNGGFTFEKLTCPIAKVIYNSEEPSSGQEDEPVGDIPMDVPVCAKGKNLDRIDEGEYTYVTYFSREQIRSWVNQSPRHIGKYLSKINRASTISKIDRTTGQLITTKYVQPGGCNKGGAALGLNPTNREFLAKYYDNGALRIVHFSEIVNSKSVTDCTGSFSITIFDENLNVINRIAQRLDWNIFGTPILNDPIGLHIINNKIYTVGSNGGIYVFDLSLNFITAKKLKSDETVPRFIDSKVGTVNGQSFIYLVGVNEASNNPLMPYVVQLDELLSIKKIKDYDLGNYFLTSSDNVRMYTLDHNLYLSLSVASNNSNPLVGIIKDNTDLLGIGCATNTTQMTTIDLEAEEEKTQPEWKLAAPVVDDTYTTATDVPTSDQLNCCSNEVLDDARYHFCNFDPLTFIINMGTGGASNFYWSWPGGNATTTVPELSINIQELGESNKLSVKFFKDGCWVIYRFIELPTVSYFTYPTYSIAPSANYTNLTSIGSNAYQIDLEHCLPSCEQFLVNGSIATSGWSNIGTGATSITADGWYCPFGTNLTEQVQYTQIITGVNGTCEHTDIFTVNVSDHNCLGLNGPIAPPSDPDTPTEFEAIDLMYQQASGTFTSSRPELLKYPLDLEQAELLIYDQHQQLLKRTTDFNSDRLDEVLKEVIDQLETQQVPYLLFKLNGTLPAIHGKLFFEEE